LVDAKFSLGMMEGNFVLYAGLRHNIATAPLYLRTLWRYRNAVIIIIIIIIINSGVLGNGCPIRCINTFPYYRSTFKRRAILLYYRVVGLVVTWLIYVNALSHWVHYII